MIRWLVLVIVVSVLFATPINAGPPAGGNFIIVKSSIDNGGGTSAGGNFVLQGTIGQADASIATASGGDFKVSGGFWARIVEAAELIFKDGFE